jgi:hypothetical protein
MDCFYDSEGKVALIRPAQVKNVIYLGPYAIVWGPLP